jgi:hypothetical protein
LQGIARGRQAFLERGPLHLYDPDTSEELPRIRIYAPENVAFRVQQQWLACFATRPIIISVVDSETGEPLEATVKIAPSQGLGLVSLEQTSGFGSIVRFYPILTDPHAPDGNYVLTFSAPRYETLTQNISVPPYVHQIALKEEVKAEYKEEVKAEYLLRFLVVSMNYMGEKYFEIEEVLPMLRDTPSDVYERAAMRLAYDLMEDYELPEPFLRLSTFLLGEEQKPPREVDEFITPTEAVIIDSQRKMQRASYEVDWNHYEMQSLYYGVTYFLKHISFRRTVIVSQRGE